jgi:MOSC domain-containing protein YiiM
MSTRFVASDARAVAVCCAPTRRFSKPVQETITLRASHGTEGDACGGAVVKHRSRVWKHPTQSNLRQVQLTHAKLFDALAAKGDVLAAGKLGENPTARGIDLLALPEGSELQLGDAVRVRIAGLRTPFNQNEVFGTGPLSRVLGRNQQGELVCKTAAMGVVLAAGEVRPGDGIELLADAPHRPLVRA